MDNKRTLTGKMKETLDNLKFGESASVSISDLHLSSPEEPIDTFQLVERASISASELYYQQREESPEQNSNTVIKDREAALKAVKKMGRL
jgi:hypothetical protein